MAEEINLIKISELNPANKVKDSAVIPIVQDGQTFKVAVPILEQKILDKTDGLYIENSQKGAPSGVAPLGSDRKIPNENLNINVAGGVTGYEPIGKVEEGDKRAVSGEEVFKKTVSKDELKNLVTKDELFNTEIISSLNLLNPNDLLINKWYNDPSTGNNGSIRDYQGRYMSGYISVEKGQSYKAYGMPTATNRRILGFKNKGEINAIWFFNAYANPQTGVFTIPTDIDVNYVVVAISTSYPSFLNTGMIIKGIIEIPYVPGGDNLVVTEIKKELIPNEIFDNLVTKEELNSDFIAVYENRKKDILDSQLLNTINSNKVDVNSLSKFGGFSQKQLIRNPLNIDIKNAIIPIYVHSGENIGNYNERHFYLKNLSDNGFNDIRFKANNKVLNQSIISEIDYEFVFDDRITGNTVCDQQGYIIYQDKEVIKLSKDNLTTNSTILNGYLIGINNIGDVFYHVSLDDGKIVKATKSSNYLTTSIVLNTGFATTFYVSSFKVTDDGTIFCGNYQDAFNAKVWKSSDNGNTFTLSLDQPLRQHIHSLVIDKTTTPNTVYANIDGYISGNANATMALYKTIDLGLNWVQISSPFPSDYGVLFAKNGKAVGGGEGAVKGSPTIYTRDLNTNEIDIKLDNFQNTQKAYSLDSAVLLSGGGHSQCATPVLYFSENMFENTKIIYIDRHIDSKVMNRSYRGGSGEYPIKPMNDDYQNFLLSSYEGSENKPFRFQKNGNKQALFFIKLDLLPASGIELEIGNNYSGIGTDIKVFLNNTNSSFSLNYNDEGLYLFDENLKHYTKEQTSIYNGSVSKRFGPLFPRKHPFLNTGAVGGTSIDINEINVSGKTIEMFYKTGAYTYASINRPILRGSNLEVSRALESQISINSTLRTNVFLRNNVREYLHLVFVFKSNSVLLYTNGFLIHTININTSEMTLNKIGGFVSLSGAQDKQDLISNFKIHEKEFNNIEVLESYYGGVIV